MYTIHRIRNTKKKIQTVHYGEYTRKRKYLKLMKTKFYFIDCEIHYQTCDHYY
jgi:hypothetical protein